MNCFSLLREFAVYALERIGKLSLKTSISVLKNLDDPGAVAPLIAAAHYSDKTVGTEAIDSLEKFG